MCRLLVVLRYTKAKIAEMRTGEGKTLVGTLPAYLNALTKKGVFIVTVNDYLAKRDCFNMGKVYTFLGLSVGFIGHQTSMKLEIFDTKEEIEENENGESFEIAGDYKFRFVPASRKEVYNLDILLRN